MGWENWPMANWHELNLDWMLKTLKDLTEKMTDDYSKIYKAISDGDSKTLASGNAISKNYTDGEISKVRNDISSQLNNDIVNLSNQIKLIYNYIDSGDVENRRYIDFEVLRIYKNLDSILKDKELKVYNPCRGVLETTEKCINDLYTYLAVHGPSALESEYFTDSEIENQKLTARNFDLYSREKLIDVFNKTKMFSPYDGLVKTVQNEVGLNALNSQSISPPSGDFENINVSEINELIVYNFDFTLYDSKTFSRVTITNIPENIKFSGLIESMNHIMTINAVWTMENINNIPASLSLGTLVGQGFKPTTLKCLLLTGNNPIDYDIIINADGTIRTVNNYSQANSGNLKIYVSATILY